MVLNSLTTGSGHVLSPSDPRVSPGAVLWRPFRPGDGEAGTWPARGEEGEMATEGTRFTKGKVRSDGTLPIPRKGGRIGVSREYPSLL